MKFDSHEFTFLLTIEYMSCVNRTFFLQRYILDRKCFQDQFSKFYSTCIQNTR